LLGLVGGELDPRLQEVSPSERELVRRARALLTTEIALAQDVPIGDAEAWVDRQLAPSR
jgi:hypothetical protein